MMAKMLINMSVTVVLIMAVVLFPSIAAVGNDLSSTLETTDNKPANYDSEPVEEAGNSTEFRFQFDDGDIFGWLSDQPEFESRLAGNEVSELTKGIWLHAKSSRKKSSTLSISFSAANVFGLDSETTIYKNSNLLYANGDWPWNHKLPIPGSGLQPGTYRIDVMIEDGSQKTLLFDVLPSAPPAILASDTPPPEGYNLAARSLGGKIVHYTGQTNDNNWAAANLIDGFSQIYNRQGQQPSSGWSTRWMPGDSAEVVLSFKDEMEAVIHAIVLNATVEISSTDLLNISAARTIIPKHIEVLVANDLVDGEFIKIAETRLWNVTGWQWIEFPPIEARYVKLRVLSNFGESRVGLSEIMVIEAADTESSILRSVERNLVAPDVGGGIAQLTSQDKERPIFRLFDGDADYTRSWSSADTGTHAAGYLPQDFIFSFSGRRKAYIERVRLTQPTYQKGSEVLVSDSAAKLVSISISDDLRRDFEEVGRLELPQEADSFNLEINKESRFLKLRVLENHGGKITTIGDLSVIEGSKPGYESILHDQVRTAALSTGITESTTNDLSPDLNEPNDSAAMATSLEIGSMVSGNLHNRSDIDYFKFGLQGAQPQTLTFDVSGSPSVRTSITLLDSNKVPLQAFSPLGDLGTQARFSWQTPPGDYFLQIENPPVNLVVVWDASGSMEGRSEELENAVRQFISGMGPGEQAQLIRFSDKVSTLLDEFSSDQQLLSETLQGQFKPHGATSLIDALNEAVSLLENQPGRSVIVAFTDGQDTASATIEGDFLQRLSLSQAGVFSIGLGGSLANYSMRTASTGHQFLASIAELSNGRYFYVQEAVDLGTVFTTIAGDLRAQPEYALTITASSEPGLLAVNSIGERIPGLAPPGVELVLDASGSMKRKVADGRSRMTVARTVLKKLVEEIPEGTNVGLRVFGHRIAEGQSGDCTDTELLVAPGPLDHTRMTSQIDSVAALGTTLIAHTLEQVAQDIAAQEQEQIVVLVTDGEEECRTDLIATVERLKDAGLNISLSVVGFAIDDAEIVSELKKVAQIGGGSFIAAGEETQLKAALNKAMATKYEVHDQAGTVIAQGAINDEALSLPTGIYSIYIKSVGEGIWVDSVEVKPGQTTTVNLDKQGSIIGQNTGYN